MGVVMMTGIMAIVEMGLSLSSQSLIPKPVDAYSQSSIYSKRDQQMLYLIYGEEDLEAIGRPLNGNDICEKLRCRITGLDCEGGNSIADNALDRFSELQGLKFDGNSKECLMAVENHHLLIRPDSAPMDSRFPYQLFSCILKDFSVRCPFELDN